MIEYLANRSRICVGIEFGCFSNALEFVLKQETRVWSVNARRIATKNENENSIKNNRSQKVQKTRGLSTEDQGAAYHVFLRKKKPSWERKTRVKKKKKETDVQFKTQLVLLI